jgi:beta-glucosidase/6-phospho-beta-glucosidase/beta-galactosidase
MEGIEFYNRLIDSLLEAGITPYVTLFHWDLPQALEDEYGGWLGRRVIDDFAMYAKLCFHHFGDRVQHWITLNESWTVAVNGYNNHVHAPGDYKHAGTETYLAAHHLLLAHAKAVQVFRELDYDGVIGISNCADYRYPADKHKTADHEAAQRAMVFQLAWFADPIWFGDYPAEMKQRLGSRLPRFTRNERRMLKGSSDFFGLNHYSSLLAAEPAEKHATYEGYWADMHVDFSTRDKWRHNDMGWSIVPSGCRELLLWISDRYDKPIIIMTENGSAEPEDDLETALQDEGRRQYFEKYLRASAEAIETGDVDMRGYFAWSLMDNFEWQFGYQRRFGICYVDFETQERTPKSSGTWYAQTIAANGHNIRRKEFSFFE